MPIPLANRIQIRTLLQPVAEFSTKIEEFRKIMLAGQAGTVTLPIGDVIKFLEEARRVQYIVTGLAASTLGVSLIMPQNKDAKMFRQEMDIAIHNQLLELENDRVDIILTDSDNHQM